MIIKIFCLKAPTCWNQMDTIPIFVKMNEVSSHIYVVLFLFYFPTLSILNLKKNEKKWRKRNLLHLKHFHYLTLSGMLFMDSLICMRLEFYIGIYSLKMFWCKRKEFFVPSFLDLCLSKCLPETCITHLFLLVIGNARFSIHFVFGFFPSLVTSFVRFAVEEDNLHVKKIIIC